MFVSLSMIYLCIYSPVCSVWFSLVYSLLPVFPVCKSCLVLPCLALMSSLKTIIWVYVLVCVFLYPPCCVHSPPAVAIPSPPAGSLVPGVPLPQARRPAADSMPAGPPLTQARRPAADSSPPDRRWIKPAGSPLTHARRSPLTLAPWIQSTCHGQESRVCVLLCPQEHFN